MEKKIFVLARNQNVKAVFHLCLCWIDSLTEKGLNDSGFGVGLRMDTGVMRNLQ